MAEDDNGAQAERSTRVETGVHESRTNALPLMIGQHRQRSQTDRPHCPRRSIDVDTAQENVTDDAIADGGDE
jgi:hypothetical protein